MKLRFESATTAAPAAFATRPCAAIPPCAAPAVLSLSPLSRCPHRTTACRTVRIDQLEVDLPLRQIDPRQSDPDGVTQLPAPSGALPDEAHAAVLKFPIISRDRRDMHQAINGHFLQLHEQTKFKRA